MLGTNLVEAAVVSDVIVSGAVTSLLVMNACAYTHLGFAVRTMGQVHKQILMLLQRQSREQQKPLIKQLDLDS